MADPVFDEDSIRALLAAPATVEYTIAIQTGAVQAAIDLYDRKVTREEFMNSIAPCITLYGQAAKLWMLHNIKDVFETGELTPERFAKTNDAMCELMRKQLQTVTEIVKRLQTCPTSRDAVH